MQRMKGAVAAPTAGLHFSKHLLKKMEIKGVNIAEITSMLDWEHLIQLR